MNLLILESPGKVKKVQSYLGNDWKVVASVGHVRDLPEREIGVALPDFTPTYTPTERGKDVLKRLKGLVAAASAVYLATDPDREGEAIAWHLTDALGLNKPKRVTYGEITAAAVQAAIKAPRSLDMQDEEADTDAPENPVPMLTEGQSLEASGGKLLTKKTKPPTRFSEASLVRELENRGIGRPATFAAIVDTILKREYVRVEKRFLVSTPLGEQVVDLLTGAFSFLDFEFTKTMEASLDAIAEGKAAYKEVMTKAHAQLMREVSTFTAKYPGQERTAPEPTDFACKVCGKPLVHMKGQRRDGSGEYDFFACSDRACNTSYPNADGRPGEPRKKAPVSKFICKSCGKPLVRRESAKGAFFGCSGYPNCKQLYQITEDGKPDFPASSKTKKRGKQ